MFEELAATATDARSTGAVGAWARVENAACARRLSAIADEFDRQLAADGSAEREQWALDNWDAVAAEVAAAENVSLGVASHQLMLAMALREQLPRVAEVFATGVISYRLVAQVVTRTRLITDPDVMAKVDTELATHISEWRALSAAKTESAIDYWVDRYDPGALRRTELRSRGRHVDVASPDDGTGLARVDGSLFAQDAAALDTRLDAMARAVCEADPRTFEQRRADALAALAHGADRLACGCHKPECAAAGATPSAVVIHVIADDEALSDDTAVQLDGAPEPGPTTSELRQMTIAAALSPRPNEAPTGPATAKPAALLGGGMLPAPLLAEKLAQTAEIVPIVHPGDAPPQRRHIPTPVLAWFVRCRDMTCRFPGCDEPAVHCDVDHTIPYPHGPTQASNLKCLCRKHHLLKTFGGWHDRQLPDGTVVWTSPHGQTYTTNPGSKLLFPSLCRPTAPVTTSEVPETASNRGLMMPRRRQTRAENRAKAIEEERRLNHLPRSDGGRQSDGLYSSTRPPPEDADPPPF